MKNNDQDGFITMIVIMLVIVIAVVGFAVYRIINANTGSVEDAYVPSIARVLNHESTSI